LLPFNSNHARSVYLGNMNKGAPENKESYLQFAPQMEIDDLSFSAFDKDKNIIGSGGFVPIWEGVYEAWLIGSDRLENHVFAVVKTCKAKINTLICEKKATRIQAAVSAQWVEANRFARFLGFQNEGLMRKYGPDKEDYNRYSLIVE